VTDGPFTLNKDLMAGYTLIQVASRDEALDWARRFPNPVGQGRPAEIDVRQLYEVDDFDELIEPTTKERFKKMGIE
jgi:hypothetical protein